MNENNFQKSRFISSSAAVSGNIYAAQSSVTEYLLLKESNKQLAAENAKLRAKSMFSYDALPTAIFTKNDTVLKSKYSYLSAKVINVTYNERNNYITINAGSKQGIKRDYAIFNSQGIIGSVKDVSDNYASVMLLQHKKTIVNSKLKNDGSFGPLTWDGKDFHRGQLVDIPTHVRIKKGDTVVTSSYSSIFPEGIPVGIVEKFERKQNDPFYTVEVRYLVDFSKLNYVYVIVNKYKEEQETLELQSQTQSDK